MARGELDRGVYILDDFTTVAVAGVTVAVLVEYCGSYVQFQYPSRIPIVLI